MTNTGNESRIRDVLRFVRRKGHIECRRQVAGKRHHVSWASRRALEHDLDAFFKLKVLGVRMRDLVMRMQGGEGSATAVAVGPRGAIDFNTFCQKPLDASRKHKPAWKWERKLINRFLNDGLFGRRQIHTIRPHEVQEAYDRYANHPKITSDNTRANFGKAFRVIFRTAVRLGYLRHDPSDALKIPSIPESRARALTLQETIRLYNAADATVRPWILLTLHAGLRPAEIARLTVSHVDLNERKITVTGSTVKNRPRQLYVHDDLMPVLREAASSIPNLPLLRTGEGEPAPFPRKEYERARKAAKLDGTTYYMLRHTFCSRLLETGTRDEETRAAIMGHRLRGMTSRYTHVTPAMIREAIERLPPVATACKAVGMDNEVDNEGGVKSA